MFSCVDDALYFAFQHHPQTGKTGYLLDCLRNDIPVCHTTVGNTREQVISIMKCMDLLAPHESAYCQAYFGYQLDREGMKDLAEYVGSKLFEVGFTVGSVFISDMLVYELLNPSKQIELKADILPRHAFTMSQLQTRRQHIKMILATIHCNVINQLEPVFENNKIIVNSASYD